MSKVILSGFIVVPSRDLASVIDELPAHISLTKSEPGCLVFEVNQRNEDINTFDVYEEFIDRESFEAHQERVRTSKWGQVTSNVQRHYEVQW